MRAGPLPTRPWPSPSPSRHLPFERFDAPGERSAAVLLGVREGVGGIGSGDRVRVAGITTPRTCPAGQPQDLAVGEGKLVQELFGWIAEPRGVRLGDHLRWWNGRGHRR